MFIAWLSSRSGSLGASFARAKTLAECEQQVAAMLPTIVSNMRRQGLSCGRVTYTQGARQKVVKEDDFTIEGSES